MIMTSYIRNISAKPLENTVLFISLDESFTVVNDTFDPALGECDSFDGGISVGSIDPGETRLFSFKCAAAATVNARTSISRIYVRFLRDNEADSRVSQRCVVYIQSKNDGKEGADKERLPVISEDESVCELLYSDFFVIDGLNTVEDVLVYMREAFATVFGFILTLSVTFIYIDAQGLTKSFTECRTMLLQACTQQFSSPSITFGEYEITQNGYKVLLDIPVMITQEGL